MDEPVVYSSQAEPAAASSAEVPPASDAAATETQLALVSEQFDALQGGISAVATMGFFCSVLLALLLGSVLYGHFVRGWRS